MKCKTSLYSNFNMSIDENNEETMRTNTTQLVHTSYKVSSQLLTPCATNYSQMTVC